MGDQPINPVLDGFFDNLVERTMGDLEPDEKHEAKLEVADAFNRLFNSRVVDSFSDEDLPEVQGLIEAGSFDKIADLAYNRGINLQNLMTDTMAEFQGMYLGEDRGQ